MSGSQAKAMHLTFDEDLYRGVRPRARRERVEPQKEPDPPHAGDTQSTIWALRKRAMDVLDTLILRELRDISNGDELDDLVDRLITDEEYLAARDTLGELSSFEQTLEVVANPQSSVSKLFTKLTSDPEVKINILTAGLIEASIKICTLQFIAQFIAHRPAGTNPALDNGSRPNATTPPPLWFMSVPGMPVEFKRSFLGREKADVCVDILWALLHNLLAHGIQAPHWLVADLAKRWRASSYEYIRLVAMLPGAELPEADVLHPEDILDLSVVIENAKKAEEGYKIRLQEAQARDAVADSTDQE